jgi:hypothetical protein
MLMPSSVLNIKNLLVLGMITAHFLYATYGSTDLSGPNQPTPIAQTQSHFPTPITQIPGHPDALAWDALPSMDYDHTAFLDTDFVYSIEGYYRPTSVIIIYFSEETTIGQVNALLSELSGEIVHVSPGIADFAPRLMLAVRIPEQDVFTLPRIARQVREREYVELALEYDFDGVISLPMADEEPKPLHQLLGHPDTLLSEFTANMRYWWGNLKEDFERDDYGDYLPRRLLTVSFLPNTTIGEVNIFLTALPATAVAIQSRRPEVDRTRLGLRVTTESFYALQRLAAEVTLHPIVETATPFY